MTLPHRFLILTGLLLATPCAMAADVVARLGNNDITVDEMRGYLETLPPQDLQAIAKDQNLLKPVIRNFLVSQLVLKEAKAKKFDQKPEVKEKLDRARDAALAELYIQSVAVVPDSYPSETELKAAYDANLSSFVIPRQYRVAQIFVAVPKGDATAEQKARKTLEDVQKKLKAKGADFSAIARQHSEVKDEADRGGEIGWLAETQVVPELRQVIGGLAEGAVAEPVRMDDGWHILRLIETKASSTRPLLEVKELLVRQLRAQRSGALRQAYVTKMMDGTPLAVNELMLTKVMPKDGKK